MANRFSNIYDVLKNNYINENEDEKNSVKRNHGHASGKFGTKVSNGAAGAVSGITAGSLAGNNANNIGSVNQYDALYSGNSFSDWYKTHYGNDYSGQNFFRPNQMNDLDWDIGQSLYNAYRNEQELANEYNQKLNNYKNIYNTQQSAAEKAYNNYLQNIENAYKASADNLYSDRSSSKQAASIMLDKAMKYLPEQMKAQGLGGLGVSSSAILEANNNYVNQLGSIMSEYNQNKQALDLGHSNNLNELAASKLENDTQRNNQYLSTLMSLEDAYNTNRRSERAQAESSVNDLMNYYRGLEAEEREREYSAQDITANNALSILEEMRINPNYSDENGNLTEDGYKRMSNYLASISSTLDTATNNMLKNYLQSFTPDTTSSSGIKDSSGKKITDYYSWNTLSSGKEIRGLGNLKITGDGNRWENKEGDWLWITYPNDDGTRHDRRFHAGAALTGRDYHDVWAYLKEARGRTPQEGDAVMYDGRLVVVVENGGLRYLEGGSGNALSALTNQLNALP